MFRKRMMICALAAALLWTPSAHAEERQEIGVVVDDRRLAFDVPPIVENDRVLVPLRGFMEPLGAKVDYNSNTRKITIRQDELTLRMTLDQREVGINKLTAQLDAPPTVVNGRVLVPLRFIGEYLGYDVAWDGAERLVTISGKSEAHQWLFRAYLKRYDVPLVTVDGQEAVLFEPQWTEPYSFSGLYEFRIGQGEAERVVNGERTGRLTGGKYTHATQGFLNEQGESRPIGDEVLHDLKKGTTYRKEGDAYQRQTPYKPDQVEDLSGFPQVVLAFLMSHHEEIEMRTLRVEGKAKREFSLSAELTDLAAVQPLIGRIVNAHLEDEEAPNFAADATGQADITVRLDAETLRVESTDVALSFEDAASSGAYTAIYHYAYDQIAPIADPEAADEE